MGAIAFVAAGVFALVDWVAVAQRRLRLEYAAKPLTLLLLLVAAVVVDLGDASPWVQVALALGLVGDVALMLASDAADDPRFLIGLGAFLLGHVAYLVAFVRVGLHVWTLLAGLLVAAGIAGLVLPDAVRGAAARGGRALAVAVTGYAVVLAAMATLAAGTREPLTAIGGVLFLVSDALIARERFATPVRRGPLLVAVTYHLAQFCLVLGLLAAA